MKITLSPKKIMTYIIMLFIILNCRSLMASLIGSNKLIVIGTMLFIPGIIVNCSSHARKNIRANNLLIKIYTLYLFAMLLLIIVGDFKNIQFVFVEIISVGLAVIWFMSSNIETNRTKAMESFTNIVYFICVVSLFFFVFGTNLSLIKPTAVYSAQRVGWGRFDYRVYFYLYNDGQRTDNFLFTSLRNIGVFLEAPMFAYVLILALYYELFLGKCKRLKVTIMLITAFTTISTTAIAFAIVLITIRFWETIRKNKILLYVVFPAVFISCFMAVAYVMYDKLIRYNGSGIVRMSDLTASLKSFLKNPIFGNGYKNSRAMDPYRADFLQHRNWVNREAGLSTGLGGILSNGGLLWGSFYVFPFVIAIRNMWKSRNEKNNKEFYWQMFNVVIFGLLVVTVVYYAAIGPYMNVLCWVNIACMAASKGKRLI